MVATSGRAETPPEFLTTDGATACRTPREREAERAFRRSFARAADEAVAMLRAGAFAAVQSREAMAWHERFGRQRAVGDHPVRNAALRGWHHAFAYVTEAGQQPFDGQRLTAWLGEVRAWASASIVTGAPRTPPRLVTDDELGAYWMRQEDERRQRVAKMTRSTNEAAPPPVPAPTPAERVQAVCMADVTPQPVRWLWPGRIALGKLSLVAGEPGLGKSFLTLDMAARVSRGDGWPCSGGSADPAGVVLLSAEDDAQDTIRPRLDAAGADCRRIRAIQAVRRRNLLGDGDTSVPFSLIDHLHLLEATIRETPGCRLVIVDPVSAFLGSTDSHNNSEVRGVLAPLSEMAARNGVAVVAVTHLNKGQGSALNRVIGSIAFTAAARAAYVVTRDEDDPARRLMLPAKNNLGCDEDGFAYRLEGEPTPHVEWEPMPVAMSADEAVGMERRRGPEPDARRDAEAWLLDHLAAGPRPAGEVFEAAKADGHSRITIKRAKAALGVASTKQEFEGRWVWVLPGSGPVMAGGEGDHEGDQRRLPPTT